MDASSHEWKTAPRCRRGTRIYLALNEGIHRCDMAVPRWYRGSDGMPRRWRYKDYDRPLGVCYDCGRNYRWLGDCVVDNDVWERINPTYHAGAGLLCPNCMLERLHALGMSGVSAMLW
jgi:hypothetical protein